MTGGIASLRHTLRKLRRAPLFTAAAVITLAAGIGANTAIFTVVNGVLLKPLPFQEPERLVGLWHTAPGLDFTEVNQGPATYFTYRDEGRVFEDVGLWAQRQVSVTGRAEPERLDAMLVTDGMFPLLRVSPVLGRVFSKEEDLPNGPEAVMLSDGYWRRQFAANPGVIGQTLIIDGQPREIIGVLPARFRFLQFDPALYLPMRLDRGQSIMGNFSYQGIARLKPGTSIAQVDADVNRMIPLAVERFPGGITMDMIKQARFAAATRPLKQDVIGDIGKVLWVLLGTVGIILLIACANVANLFLVRAEGQQREVAVRTALGASNWRVAAGFLSESVSLGVMGGGVGIALAWAGVRLLTRIGPESLPRLHEVTLDPVVLVFATVLSVLAGLLFGMIPVLKYGRPHLVSALKEGGRANSAGRERHRTRNALVVAQVALALVLLIGSGLMIRSFQAMRQVEPGFRDPSQLLTLRLAIPTAEVADAQAATRMHEQIAQRLAAIPGVTSVGMSSSVTMSGNNNNDAAFFEDFLPPQGQLPPIRRMKNVSPGYPETMGNPLKAGRTFDWNDVHTVAPVAMISENLAREYWGNAAGAIGRRVRTEIGAGTVRWAEIVGVLGDEHDDGVEQKAPPTVYWPLVTSDGRQPIAPRSLAYVIRSSRVGTASFMDQVREAVWSVNANLPLASVRTMQAVLDRSMARTSFTLVMLAIAAAVALLLGAVGIYGVISYIVAQRTREFGVRIALGAQRGDVRRMVLSRGLALAMTGVVIGLSAAAALSRLMGALLYGVKPVDVLTYATVSLTVAGIALLACWLPARRATRIAPIEALRAE